MKRALFTSGILPLLLWLSTPAYSSTIINGGNMTTTTWTLSGSPYIVMGDINILAGATLTIDPGVIVKFALSDQQASGTDVLRCELIVQGTLVTKGTSVSTVLFTSNGSTPSNSDWYGIVIGDTGDANMSYTKIEYCLHIILPDAAGIITGTSIVCMGTSGVTYSVPAIARATSYFWTLPDGATGTSSTNSISVDFDHHTAASGNIKVVGHNTYGDGPESSFAITVNSPPTQPVSVSGPSTICSGSSNTYSTAVVNGATSYTWTLPDGWTGTSTTTSINTTANATEGDISVTANNSCPSMARTLPITINNTPVPPGSISGNATICSASPNTYSITPVSGATSYTWTLPGGWTGSSTTNSINTTASTTSGDISVTANNEACSSSAETLAITVNIVPSQPGTISGNATACAGSTVTYSVGEVSGATSYTWTLPNGWTGSSETNSISTTAGTISGDISVTANSNTCGSSPSRTITISASTPPPQPIITQVNSNIVELVSSSDAGNQWFRNDIAIAGATNNILIVTQTGSYSVEVNDNGCTSPRSDAFSINITGIETPGFTAKIQMFPNPATQNIMLHLPARWQPCEAYIYDARGRLIENIRDLSDETVLSIGHYARGLYQVVIRVNNEYHRMKFMKE